MQYLKQVKNPPAEQVALGLPLEGDKFALRGIIAQFGSDFRLTVLLQVS